jgi:hypothetical protein
MSPAKASIAALGLVLGLGAGSVGTTAHAEDHDLEQSAVAPTPRPEFHFEGPIELQDVFLPAQLRPQSYPESAEVLPRGGFSVRAVVDWTNHLAQSDNYLFDGESVTSVLRLRYGPWERVEVGIDIPWTSRFDGTLDPFIEAVETSLDQQVQARFELPRSNWTAIAVRDDGSRTLQMRDGNGIGDISLRGKYALVRQQEHRFDAAVVASLGLPTGSSTFGGEGVTPGLGLHAQLPFETVNLFGGATLQYHCDATEQDFALAPWRWMTYAGAEWRPWRSWFGVVAEYQVYGPLARVDDPLTDPSHYYAGGFRFYLPKRVTLETTVVENLGAIENRNSSDVSFHFAATWRFGN